MAMVKNKEMNTICAISTPYGSGGIAVIRVSGESAIPIVDSLFHGRKSLLEAAAYTVHYGEIRKPTPTPSLKGRELLARDHCTAISPRRHSYPRRKRAMRTAKMCLIFKHTDFFADGNTHMLNHL